MVRIIFCRITFRKQLLCKKIVFSHIRTSYSLTGTHAKIVFHAITETVYFHIIFLRYAFLAYWDFICQRFGQTCIPAVQLLAADITVFVNPFDFHILTIQRSRCASSREARLLSFLFRPASQLQCQRRLSVPVSSPWRLFPSDHQPLLISDSWHP